MKFGTKYGTRGTLRKKAEDYELEDDTRLSNIVTIGVIMIFASLSCIVLVMI